MTGPGSLLRRRWPWALLVLLSAGAVFYTVRTFPSVYPIVSLDLRMDRDSAFAAARALAREHGWWRPEKPPREAASFRVDQEVQTFVELEGGGKPAFRRLVTGTLFSPYTWTVRQFRPGEAREIRVRFTPSGRFDGFVEQVPEKEPGASLTADSARALAERVAVDRWHADLASYALVESATETRPSGRVDHTFTYERPERDIGEGRYRLRLVVSGDRLTELTRFIQVPEAFTRRYAEMRSANDGIAAGAGIGVLLLYGIGGVGGGIFFLLRRRALAWRPAVRWGGFIAGLGLAASAGEWQLLWMNYDTALPVETFVLKHAGLLVLGFVGTAAMLTLSFVAAEGLTRLAFGHHPRLWRVWTPEAAASPEILGRTVGGYLLVALFFAYQVVLFIVSTRWWDWWNPSDALIQPDLLAHSFPWLSAIAPSLQAGFWEECLFRAVPLAGAALIGQRLGHRNAWIAVAFVLQAVIFGAGHANYPTQPAYARLVELVLPSFVFGGLYLAYGLLPGVVMHFVYDVVWFALPLFVSFTPGIWVDRTLVVLCTLVPFAVVLVARMRMGRWAPLPDAFRNAAWQPEPAGGPAELPVAPVEAPPVTARRIDPRVVAVAGIVGLVAWARVALEPRGMPAITIGRREAIAIARDTLAGRGVVLPAAWRFVTEVQDTPGEASRFVWRTAGRDTYYAVLGSYINGPGWAVRAVTFRGDVAERAETWELRLAADGRVLEVEHTLPEGRPGATLDEAAARALALAEVRSRFGLDSTALRQVSATPARRPARTDWTFVFADGSGPRLPQGECRVQVVVSGDQVTDAFRFVHVPEEWQRNEKPRRTLETILTVLSTILIAALFFGGVAAAVVRWSRRTFPVRPVLRGALVLAALQLGVTVNQWASIPAGFRTTEPLERQVLFAVLGAALVVMLVPLAVALVAGLGVTWAREQQARHEAVANSALAGLAIGTLATGVTALGSSLKQDAPDWPTYLPAGDYVPWLSAALAAPMAWVTVAAMLAMLFGSVLGLSQGWTRRRLLAIAWLFVAGFILGGAAGTPTLNAWLATGIATGVFVVAAWLLVIRHDLVVLPFAALAMSLLGALRMALAASYPGAVAGGLLRAAVLAALLWWFWRRASASDSDATLGAARSMTP
ncbi:MAG: hypothetical protein ACOY71_07945 [Gemmatimonadota bacterium]